MHDDIRKKLNNINEIKLKKIIYNTVCYVLLHEKEIHQDFSLSIVLLPHLHEDPFLYYAVKYKIIFNIEENVLSINKYIFPDKSHNYSIFHHHFLAIIICREKALEWEIMF